MEIKKELIGSTYHKGTFVVEICEDNIKLLKALKADVFVKKEKVVKFKGIKDNDDTNK
tara:strand:+ start:416 stop:589 length:174 start_codon:yes stop_codon:yes gene_type:complete